LSQQTGKAIDLSVRVDASLIGGVIAFYNIYKTISTSGAEARVGDQPIAASRAAE
jgi:F0F1-type ATP synthase delta subunit